MEIRVKAFPFFFHASVLMASIYFAGNKLRIKMQVTSGKKNVATISTKALLF